MKLVAIKPQVGVAIVGYGGMGKAHAYAYRVAPMIESLPCEPQVRVITGRTSEAVERAARAYDIPEWSTDWRAAIQRPDVDIVDVCTPPGTHAEIVEAAAQAGKAIVCEKPLATSYADGLRAVTAVRQAGRAAHHRFQLSAPARRRAHQADGGSRRCRAGAAVPGDLADRRVLGSGHPFDWRFDRHMGGTTIADLGAHLFDLGRWIVGDIDEVVTRSATFVPQRAKADGRGTETVTVDDASSALVHFASGAQGTFEMARSCVRRPCDLTVEVNGTDGTLFFDYSRLNELWYGSRADDPGLYGLRRIRAEHPSHPFASRWWPIGQGVGWGTSFVNQVCDLLVRWPDGPWTPNLEDGLQVQAICEAMERSAQTKRWVAVGHVAQDQG